MILNNRDGRHWFVGAVVMRDDDVGVIRAEDGLEYRFTNMDLARDQTHYAKTVVGCTVYFGTRTIGGGIAEIVSWSPPRG